MPIDIPITIPANETFRDTAIGALWKWPQHLRYDELNDTAQKQVDRTAEQLRDAYIRGADAVTRHYEDQPVAAEKPKLHNWLVVTGIGQGGRLQQIVAADGWQVASNGDLVLGAQPDEHGWGDYAACFAAGHWQYVVRQVENNTEVNIDGGVE